MNTHLRTIALGIAAAAALASGPALAETMKMKATLSGTQEVPPTASAGKGEVDVTYDAATKALSWQGTYSDLTGPATAAHFHGAAAVGHNAGVMVPVSAGASPFMGTATLTEAQVKALETGDMYFNIHTAANPGGEIRGQVAK